MPIEYVKGNLLDAPERIIVHGCNAQGVMGSGVAKAVREKWPEAYNIYKKTYDWYNYADDGLKVGMIAPAFCDGKIIVNAITQEFYGRDPKVRYVSYPGIEKALYGVRIIAREYSETTIAMPKIGAGLGNGDWDVISGIIDKVFAGHIVKVYEL